MPAIEGCSKTRTGLSHALKVLQMAQLASHRPILNQPLAGLNQSLGALSQIQITVPKNTMPTLRESAHQPQQEGPSQPQEDLIQPVQASLLRAFFYHIRYLNSRIGIWRESNKWVDKCMAIDSLGNYKDFIL